MNLTWVEVSKSALLNNIAVIKKRLPPRTKFISVVKSNAYGHGLLQVVDAIKSKVDYFAVYDFNDAILLRKNKITKPLLLLGRLLPSQIDLAVKNEIEFSVSNFDLLENVKKKISIHLAIDTGLGRDGFVAKDMPQVLKLLQNKNISVKGLYTHFAAPDDSKFNAYTKKQIAELLKWKSALAKINIKPLVHASSSAGTFIEEFDCCLDAVRVGGGVWGLWSSEEVKSLHKHQTELKPVLSWKCSIVELKSLPKGSKISYGGTFTLKRDSKIAILPIGYFDGIPRNTSNKGYVLINGIKVRQIGRVTMNMIIVDVTDVKKIKVGDEAMIIGQQAKETISAEDWGQWAESFNYEITTRINPNIPRKLSR